MNNFFLLFYIFSYLSYIYFLFDTRLFLFSSFKQSFAATFGGKTSEQSEELRTRLSKEGSGPSDWKDAMRGYKNSYNHKLPDHAFYDQLAALNWEHRRSMKDSPIVLFVGAMTVGKGIQTLICSFGALLSDYPDAQLLLIGSGSYREVLEGLVHALTTNNMPLLDYIVNNGGKKF